MNKEVIKEEAGKEFDEMFPVMPEVEFWIPTDVPVPFTTMGEKIRVDNNFKIACTKSDNIKDFINLQIDKAYEAGRDEEREFNKKCNKDY